MARAAKRKVEVEEDGPQVPHPREQSRLVGHAAAERQILEAYASGRMPHAWLISGPEGIGKATLAYRFARFLLAGYPLLCPPLEGGQASVASRGEVLFSSTALPPPASPRGEAAPPPGGGKEVGLAIDIGQPVFRRVAQSSHPDLLVIDGEAPREKERKSKDIIIDDVRKLNGFLALTPAAGAWRVVIVDTADAMNRNAANALLKLLEEPPVQTVLLLVSHAPGRLLPTIRSRCRSLKLNALGEEDFRAVLAEISADVPIKEKDIALLAELSGNAPGVAMRLHLAGAVEMARETAAFLPGMATVRPEQILSFAGRAAARSAPEVWEAFSRVFGWCIARLAAALGAGEGGEPGHSLSLRERVRVRAEGGTEFAFGPHPDPLPEREGGTPPASPRGEAAPPQGGGRELLQPAVLAWRGKVSPAALARFYAEIQAEFSEAEKLNLDKTRVMISVAQRLQGVLRDS